MLYIDGIGISFLIKELKEKVLNYRLTKIHQYDKSSLTLYFGKQNLLFQVKDNHSIVYVKNEKDTNTDFQSKFLLSLKKHILNSILIDIRQEGFDRIIYFDFEKLNQFGDIEKYTLIFEIMGKSSNIFLTETNKILNMLSFSSLDQGNRILMTGAYYALPFETSKTSPMKFNNENFIFESVEDLMSKIEGVGKHFAVSTYNNFDLFEKNLNVYKPTLYTINKGNTKQEIASYNEFSTFEEQYVTKVSFDSLNALLNEYFKLTITTSISDDKKKTLLKYIETQIKKNNKILKNISVDIESNKNNEKIKQTADILAANMHALKMGLSEINVYDFYENKDSIIQLNPLKSPKENLNIYYSKYNKAKRTIDILEERTITVKSELNYLEETKLYVEKETDFIGLEEIETELKIQTNKRKIKLNKHKKRELLSYEYNDHKILVGRNNKENDEITFSKGQFSDVWLHIKNLPGSHVLIIKGNSKIGDDTLLYAARLAAEFSKASPGDKVTVDYCEKRFVKKIKGGKLGNVTYSGNNSLTLIV